MTNKKKVQIERERPFSPHHMLLGAARLKGVNLI